MSPRSTLPFPPSPILTPILIPFLKSWGGVFLHEWYYTILFIFGGHLMSYFYFIFTYFLFQYRQVGEHY